MDPVTVLGGAAAGIQVVDVAARALLGSIKLIYGLCDAPDRTQSLLSDVEKSSARVSHICTTLLKPGSDLYNALSPEQYARLSPCINHVSRAMRDTQSLLSKLCATTGSPNQHASHLRRTWKAALALVRHEEVVETLARVDRLNLELLREVEVVGLEIQATIRNNQDLIHQGFNTMNLSVEETKSNIEHAQTVTVGRLDTVQTIASDILTTTHQSALQTSHILGHVASLKTEANIVSTNLDRIHQSQTTQISEFQKLQTDNRIMHAELQAQLQAMSNNLVKVMISNASSTSQSMLQGIDTLSVDEMAELERGVRRHLVRKPTALRDAHQISRRSLRAFRQCKCVPLIERKEFRMRQLWFTSGSESQHRVDCPLYAVGHQSWHHTITAQLLPFVNKTMELTLGATQGAGQWSVCPPLRFTGTVRRSESPIFRIFDELPHRCAKVSWQGNTVKVTKSSTGSRRPLAPHWLSLVWDVEKTRSALKNGILEIQRAIGGGKASGADVDEMGNTFLSAVLMLTASMGDTWQHVSAELAILLQLSITAGTDIWRNIPALDRKGERPLYYYLAPGYHMQSKWEHGQEHWSCTALDILLMVHRTSWEPRGTFDASLTIPLFSQLQSLELFESSTKAMIELTNSCESPSFRSSAEVLGILLHNPGVAEELGYDDLSLAVVNRRLEDVKKFSKRQIEDLASKCIPDRFSLLELAVGWSEGLRHLVPFNLCANKAIMVAFENRDVNSLSLLLGTSTDIFQLEFLPCNCEADKFKQPSAPFSIFTAVKHVPPGRHTLELFRLVVGEFARRRQAVNSIALEVLLAPEIAMFGLSRSQVLDRNAPAVYDALQSRMDIPAYLNCCSMTSAYDSPIRLVPSTQHLDILFDAGFTSVDIPDASNLTLLNKTALSYSWHLPFSSSQVSAIFWLLDRGANPKFYKVEVENSWPTCLFYLMEGVSQTGFEGLLSPRHEIPGVGSLSRAAVAALKGVITMSDHCICFCSGDGCIPTSLVWRLPFDWLQCRLSLNHLDNHSNRAITFSELFTMLALDELQVTEILFSTARLKLFERLGMAHTCCARRHSKFGEPSSDGELSDSDDEFKRLREEDVDLAAHLDVLLEEYLSGRTHFEGSAWQYWDAWWQVVDMILPPLTENQVWPDDESLSNNNIQTEKEPYQNDGERAALISCGYDPDMPFADIIALHFDKYRQRLTDVNWLEDSEGDIRHDDGLGCGHGSDRTEERLFENGHVRRSGWVKYEEVNGTLIPRIV
ncbi:hypothetical protein QBC43DRAFT_109521 [Cladorrhinum sp. PSN259]|nr:hypothetical protein QBC43DRAFT_109521 [Cladorrhinum sp. PSN259]